MSSRRPHPGWTFAITAVALFMVVLDNLVVTTALPSIRADLGGGVQDLEWTVNAYTLTFAVLLLTGAALGDRFGRRRMFLIGLGLFTVSSAAAALAPATGALIAARALQGAGAAIVTPLTLTLLSEAFPPEKRGLAIGAWSGISGLGVALGPLVGGAVVDGISWHWIFWLNVPIGVALAPVAARRLTESFGPAKELDLPGLGLAGFGLLGVVYGIVRGNELGWTSGEIVASLAAGAALLAAFVAWELRAAHPMLPMRFFRSRAFAASNGVSLAMYFGVFGSIFLLAQFFQVTQHFSPLEAGIRTLPWTGMPMLVAPVAGLLSDRIGSRPLMVAGLSLQAIAIAWLAGVSTPTVAYSSLVVPFVLAGTGMALVFAPTANAVLNAVRPQEAGQASGATNAIREVGGVLGIAVLASVFGAHGSYASPQAFTDGMTSAIWIGAAVLAAGALLALLVPGRRVAASRDALEPAPAAG
ncbi:MFS transporter [Candidatus Solirubrobacter pratensis]|uniref:MFS transporter n=1 Tax=Candidatus Solirubrobacter pratensis TaxID=1298857 RepID=UPI0005652E4C|nr:MFS transporter [Candidatus Solirubrobacter pratensis]